MKTASATGVRAFSAAAAVVAWFGVLLQLVLSLQLAAANGKSLVEGLVIYFGYFTVLTNLFVALALAAPLLAPRSPVGRFAARPDVATTAAAAITVVGVAYFLLLRKVWNPQGWQLVADVVLHYVTPGLFLAYWWLAVPKRDLDWSSIPKWALYPLGYVLYVLLRGAVTGHYPYHFIDVAALGLATALRNAAGILLGFLLVSATLALVARRGRREDLG